MRVWPMRKRVRTISSFRVVLFEEDQGMTERLSLGETVAGVQVVPLSSSLVGDEVAHVTDKVWSSGTKTGMNTRLPASLFDPDKNLSLIHI